MHNLNLKRIKKKKKKEKTEIFVTIVIRSLYFLDPVGSITHFLQSSFLQSESFLMHARLKLTNLVKYWSFFFFSNQGVKRRRKRQPSFNQHNLFERYVFPISLYFLFCLQIIFNYLASLKKFLKDILCITTTFFFSFLIKMPKPYNKNQLVILSYASNCAAMIFKSAMQAIVF